MHLSKTEGVILHTLNFKESHQILTVFTAAEGVIKLVCHGARSAKRKSGANTSPLTQAEFVYRRSAGDLMTCREISVLDAHLGVRKSLAALNAAGALIRAVNRSQFQGKPSPQLYRLFLRYLQAIPEAACPDVFACSFRLKLLWHDGLLSDPSSCNVCQAPLTQIHIVSGECLCPDHAPPGAVTFSEMETYQILTVLLSRSLSTLTSSSVEMTFVDKIHEAFEEAIFLA